MQVELVEVDATGYIRTFRDLETHSKSRLCVIRILVKMRELLLRAGSWFIHG